MCVRPAFVGVVFSGKYGIYLDHIMSNGKMFHELERSGRYRNEELSQHLRGGTQEKPRKLKSS
jgi:hypothetical protein